MNKTAKQKTNDLQVSSCLLVEGGVRIVYNLSYTGKTSALVTKSYYFNYDGS